jgi:nicotinate-nucleotide adenylyltransferase
MVDIAIAGNPRLKTEDIELLLPKPNYTYDTLQYLQTKYPEKEFVLIIGEDNLVGLNKWKNYEQILEQYQVYVYPRPYSLEAALKNHPRVTMVNCPLLDISSTFVRECIRMNRSIRYLVADGVERYIQDHRLFQV